jgi:hypothetical protein
MARRSIWAVLVLCFHIGCIPSLPCHDEVPATKNEYLSCFHSFSETVSTNCSEYTSWEWELIDRKFRQLSADWYRMFSKQLSPRERVDVIAYCGKYFQCRINTASEDWLEQLEKLLYEKDFELPLKELLITSPLKN